MKSIDIDRVVIQGEQGATLEMFRDNMGEPYRSGVSIWIEKPGDGRDRHSVCFSKNETLTQSFLDCKPYGRNYESEMASN
jgi:hypothetical protein